MSLIAQVHALIMGVVEGLTEFLPVSSTGHLIVVGDLLGFQNSRGKMFEIVIQSGAIFAVAWFYRARLSRLLAWDAPSRRFLLHLFIAFIPAAILGLLLIKTIKAHFFSPIPVAAMLIIGALVIFWVERRRPSIEGATWARVNHVDEITWKDALKIGIFQCFSLLPGTSRSAATILGAMWIGCSRPTAAEFSFFLALPVLMMATVYELWKERALLSMDDAPVWAVGFIAAFVSALLCVRWLLHYVSTHTFRPFAWYRIAFGLFILLSGYMGWVNWSS